MALGCPIGDAAPALSLQAAQPVLQMKLMSSVINLYLWRELLLPITYPPSLACDLAQGCWCPPRRGELEGVSGGGGCGGGTDGRGEQGVRGWSCCQGLDPCCRFGLFLMFFPRKTSACCSLMSAGLYGHLLQMSNSISLSG